MNIIEALNTLESKINKYNTLSKESTNLADKYNSEVTKVKTMYNTKKQEEHARYLQAIKDICAKEKIAIDSVPLINFDYNELEFAFQDEKSFRNDLLENFKIDHNLMCQLLEQETNMAWKHKVIVGHSADPVTRYSYAYGTILVNEKNPVFYASRNINYNPILENDSDTILCNVKVTYPEIYRNICQEETNNYNWLDFYIHKVGLVPEYEIDEEKNDLPKCGVYEDVVKNAIAKHIQSLSLSSLSENDIEEPQA